MTEQIKAWAVVNKDGIFNGTLYNSEYAANTRLTELQLIGKVAPYKLVELTSTPKIKMTQAEWDEFLELKNGKGTLFFALEKATIDSLMFKRLHNNSNENEDNKAQLEFAQLWASDNPAELVEIAKEPAYHLISKADSFYSYFLDKNDDGLLASHLPQEFTQSEIDELGGDDWLAEMGLEKKELTE